MPYALLLFIAVPIIEIALLLRVGDAIGWVSTLLVVIVTAIIGSAMLRQQGLATLNKARQRMDGGELPAQQLLEGVIIMIGGVLLLTPGLVTDAAGFFCLIPVTRQWLAAKFAVRAVGGFAGERGGAADDAFARAPYGESSDAPNSPHHAREHGAAGAPNTGRAQSRQKRSDGQIIDGDFTRIDDD